MRRYDVLPYENVIDEYPIGDYVLYKDVAPLIAAVDKLLAAKGRFHTEQNYKALAEARAALEKA